MKRVHVNPEQILGMGIKPPVLDTVIIYFCGAPEPLRLKYSSAAAADAALQEMVPYFNLATIEID